MSWTILSYTVVHVAPADAGEVPYTVVVVERGGVRRVVRLAGRVDGLVVGEGFAPPRSLI